MQGVRGKGRQKTQWKDKNRRCAGRKWNKWIYRKVGVEEVWRGICLASKYVTSVLYLIKPYAILLTVPR